MQRFLFIIREDLTKLEKMTSLERYSRSMEEHMAWIRSLVDAGMHQQGEPLAIKGRLVRKDQIIVDGPFVDAKEGIAGFDVILAENLEQAAEIALTCPLVRHEIAIIEVRPIDGLELLTEALNAVRK
jgi:hypothetical protein